MEGRVEVVVLLSQAHGFSVGNRAATARRGLALPQGIISRQLFGQRKFFPLGIDGPVAGGIEGDL